MREETGMDAFPVDEDNHFIDILRVFNLAVHGEKLVNLNPKEVVEGPEKAVSVTNDFNNLYKGMTRLQELTNLEGLQITFTIKNVFEKFSTKIYAFEIRIMQEVNLE